MKIIKKHSTLLFFSTILWLFSSLVSAGSSYNLQTHILSMPVVSIDGANLEVNLNFDGDKKFTLIDSKPSTQSSDQPVIFNSGTGVATIPYVVVAETGQAYTATLTLISSNPVVTLELTSLKKIDEDSSIVIQEIYNLNLKHNDICRKGDQIRVKGLNLDKLESPDLMFASISIARIAKYIKKEEKALYFECQKTEHYGDIDIFLKSDTVASRATVLTSLAVSTPVITDVSYNSTTNKITVTGFNLNKQLTINLGDVNVKLDQQNGDPNTFSFTAYALIKSGELKVIVDGAHSNSVWVKINKTIKGKIKFVSNGVDSTHLVVGVNEDDNHPSVSGDFQMDGYRGKPTFIPVFFHSPDQNERPEYILHLAAIALPEDEFIEVSPVSTAIALLWTGMNVELSISPNDYIQFREQIAALPETILFTNLLAQKLAINPLIMQEEFKVGALYDANFSALSATYQLIGQYQTSREEEKSRVSFFRKADSKKAKVTPKEVDDIQIYESDNNDGNITVENDTQLFLAVEIKDVEGVTLQKYPPSSFSALISKPQNSWSIASEKAYKQPEGKHSIVTVLTPGRKNNHNPLICQTSDLCTHLTIRTQVERVLFPFIDGIFKISGSKVSQIIITASQKIVFGVGAALSGESSENVMNVIVDGILDDFLNTGGPGPLAKYYMTIYGIPPVDVILEKIGGQIAMQGIPIVGQIRTALKIIDLASTGATVAVAIFDIESTNKEINFNVQFPVKIKSVYPSQFQENELKNDITIHGDRFGAVIDEENGRKVYPEVYFRDPEGVIKSIEVNENNIKDNGKQLIIKLPDEFKKPTTKFPLDLAIRHPTTNPNPDFPIVDNAIDLISGFQITGIDRDESLVLNGYCHSPRCGTALNEVSSSAAYLNWTGFNPSSSTHSVMFLNRKLKVCKIPTTKSQLGRVCYDSARTSYDRTGERLLPEQFIQPEGSIAAVFKTYPVSVFSSQHIKMPYRCPDNYVVVEHDPNKKYRVEWEMFLEKREFNSDSGLFEPVERTQTVNFAYDCHYYFQSDL